MQSPLRMNHELAGGQQTPKSPGKGLYSRLLGLGLDLIAAMIVGNAIAAPLLLGTLKGGVRVANSVRLTVVGDQSSQSLAAIERAIENMPGVKSIHIWTEGNRVILDVRGSRIAYQRLIDLAKQQGYKFAGIRAEEGGLFDERTFFMLILATQVGFFLVYSWRQRGGDAKSYRALFSGSRWWRLIGWGLVTGFAALIVTNLISWVQVQVGIPPPQQTLIRGALTGETWWLVALGTLGTVILAPLMEEVFFRGYVFDTLLKYNKATAYFMSAAMFAVIHLEPAVLLPLFAAGLVLAYSYCRAGNLTVSVVGHAVNNLAGMVLIYQGIGS